MSEEFSNVKTIDLDMGARVYINTDEDKKVEDKSLKNVDLNEQVSIKLKTWHCKRCDIDNQGIICSKCCLWWRPADPDCYIKE